ncbi:uncharacterized protein CIMG_13487 [Coccidioides immitis RS]|uniref:Uncharacterized protein n=1 Tax=Coccidioides immitis (strain RS) TaxID=246410 RepID=A0A0D8JWA8_COCIM|nr:uncharacterized protein CIMG_13487 [Coccidioides immitis RS]KJF61206.1 hypothetical protein CIMG_13487 [Coccidioides immitis RS]
MSTSSWSLSKRRGRKRRSIAEKRLQRLRMKLGRKRRLEVKIMAHDHNCLAVVGVLRERVEEEMREFLDQLQGLSEDNNSLSAPEEMEKDDFEIVVSSDKNDEEDNETEDDWIIDI